MTSNAKIRFQIESIANTLSDRGKVMQGRTLRMILKRLGLRDYKNNRGCFTMVRATHARAKKRGDLVTARNIQYAFVRDSGRHAWLD